MGNPIVLQMLAPPILTSSAQHGYTRQAGGTWKESFAVVTDIRNPYKEAKLHSLGLKATQVSCQWQCGRQQSEWRKTTRLLVSENCVKIVLAPILNAVGGTNTWCWCCCCYRYRLQSDWSVHVWTRDAGVATGRVRNEKLEIDKTNGVPNQHTGYLNLILKTAKRAAPTIRFSRKKLKR